MKIHAKKINLKWDSSKFDEDWDVDDDLPLQQFFHNCHLFATASYRVYTMLKNRKRCNKKSLLVLQPNFFYDSWRIYTVFKYFENEEN